jgi:hypothetical protein
LGDTENLSVEELAFASRPSKRMSLQGEILESPCDTSGLSTTSTSLYTPESDLDLFDPSFSLAYADPRSHAYDEKPPGLFQDGPQFASSYASISDSRSLSSTSPNTVVHEKVIWESPRETSSLNAPLSFENFNFPPQTPLSDLSSIRVAREDDQTFNTAEMRHSTCHRGPNVRPPSRNSQRRLPSPKLPTADILRSSTSPNTNHPKRNLKRAHNMIEKQYRHRLNSHFASLLAKIPAELAVSTGLDNIGGGKNISKAETLVLAERYIKMLQDEERVLREKNKRLEEDYERLKKAWIRSGGILMP